MLIIFSRHYDWFKCASESPFLILEYRYAGLGWRATEPWNKDNSEALTSEGKTRKDADGTTAKMVIVQGAWITIMEVQQWCPIHPTITILSLCASGPKIPITVRCLPCLRLPKTKTGYWNPVKPTRLNIGLLFSMDIWLGNSRRCLELFCHTGK